MPAEPAHPPHPPAAAGTALVTGGGRGIGLAVASALADAGWKVALVARSAEETERAARDIVGRCGAGSALALDGDVTDLSACARFVAEARARLGDFGLLVNAAGIAESAPYAKTGADLLRRHLETNLLGAHHTMSLILPGMTEAGRGHVVNIASTAGLQGYPYASAYAASKHALVGLTRSIALEAIRSGVRVNAVCPGFVDTPLLERSLQDIVTRTGRSRDEARASLAKMNPCGRLLRPEEVAEAVLWLLSPDADGIHGEAVVVDGLASAWSADGGLPINPEALGEARGYSNGMIHRSGRTLFVAGQVAWDRNHRIVGGDDFAAQFDTALANVLRVVVEAGGRADQIGRLRIYVADRDRYLASLREVGRAYRKHMGAHYPAMALVEVSRLLEEGALVEIEAEAIL